MSEAKLIGHTIAQIDTVRTTKDGGFKVTFEMGQESLALTQELMKQLQVNNGVVYLTVTDVIDSN